MLHETLAFTCGSKRICAPMTDYPALGNVVQHHSDATRFHTAVQQPCAYGAGGNLAWSSECLRFMRRDGTPGVMITRRFYVDVNVSGSTIVAEGHLVITLQGGSAQANVSKPVSMPMNLCIRVLLDEWRETGHLFKHIDDRAVVPNPELLWSADPEREMAMISPWKAWVDDVRLRSALRQQLVSDDHASGCWLRAGCNEL